MQFVWVGVKAVNQNSGADQTIGLAPLENWALQVGLGIVWILTILIPNEILPFDSGSYQFLIPIL